jgi:hypothetical protein
MRGHDDLISVLHVDNRADEDDSGDSQVAVAIASA